MRCTGLLFILYIYGLGQSWSSYYPSILPSINCITKACLWVTARTADPQLLQPPEMHSYDIFHHYFNLRTYFNLKIPINLAALLWYSSLRYAGNVYYKTEHKYNGPRSENFDCSRSLAELLEESATPQLNTMMRACLVFFITDVSRTPT